MAKKNNSDQLEYNVRCALAKARKINGYARSVEMITGKLLNTEKAKAFLLYLAESAFAPGDERDIVLASWRLLQGFESVKTLKGCHELFSELSAYEGAPGGLNHREADTLYPEIAKYYKNIPDKDAFLAEAIRIKLPGKKGKVQLPELHNKKAAIPVPTVSHPDNTELSEPTLESSEAEPAISASSVSPPDSIDLAVPVLESPKEKEADKNQRRKKKSKAKSSKKEDHRPLMAKETIIHLIIVIPLLCIVLYFQVGPGKEQLALSRLEKSMGNIKTEEMLSNNSSIDVLLFQLQKDIEELKIENAQFEELSSRAESGDIEAAYQLGAKYFTEEDYENAYQWTLMAAEAEHSEAQAILGYLYMYGRGVEKNIEEAFRWTLKSAEQGNPSGQNNVGYFYETGTYVEEDYTKAFEWYQSAANQGNSAAKDNLGFCYFNGLGTSVDHTKALEYFQLAFSDGYTFAAKHIAFFYQNGYVVKVDMETAIKWYSIGAENNDPSALAELGKIYENGDGVQEDLTTAFNYYVRAAELGNTWAMRTVAYWYCTNKYVETDYGEALKWLTRVSEAGDQQAVDNLHQLEETLDLLRRMGAI